MKKGFVIYHTDLHISYSSFRTIGVARTIGKAISLAKKDADAVSDVEEEEGCIVIYEFEFNKLESEKQVFSTTFDYDRVKITKKERP